jgi:hypothetical protein
MTNTDALPDRSLLRRGACAALVATTLAATTVALSAPASASGGDAVRASGSCSAGATWKLKAKPDNGRIEVEFEVDSNKVGQTWRVRLRDNGELFFAGSRTTQAPSGSFTVHRRTADLAGSDLIRARAVHGDQVCRGHVTL